jgi:hypothetical protein
VFVEKGRSVTLVIGRLSKAAKPLCFVTDSEMDQEMEIPLLLRFIGTTVMKVNDVDEKTVE